MSEKPKQPLVVGGVFTSLIILAAILPGLLPQLERYDAGLAVLALTAIAVTWYTTYTFIAVKQAGSFRDADSWIHRQGVRSRAVLLRSLVANLPELIANFNSIIDAPPWTETDEQTLLAGSIALPAARDEFVLATSSLAYLRNIRKRFPDAGSASQAAYHAFVRKPAQVEAWNLARKEALDSLDLIIATATLTDFDFV